MRVRHGPAAVRGDAPSPRRHWPAGREGGGGGSPESEDLTLAWIRSPRGRRKRASPSSRSPRGFPARPRPRLVRWRRRRRAGAARAGHLLGCCRDHARPARVPGHGRGRQRFRSPWRSSPTRSSRCRPTATESLFAIGAGDQVIAVDDQSNYPAEAPVTDLSGFQPNVEAIAGYEPDLVIAAYDPGGLVEGLETLDIPVLLQDAAPNLDAAYEQIETLGEATGQRRGRGNSGRVDADRDRGDGRLRARRRGRDRLPRARPRLLHGHLGHVHRQRLRALRAREHRRRCRGRRRRRLPAARGGVHRLGEPRRHRPRRHDVLRADGRDRRGHGPAGTRSRQ